MVGKHFRNTPIGGMIKNTIEDLVNLEAKGNRNLLAGSLVFP